MMSASDYELADETVQEHARDNPRAMMSASDYELAEAVKAGDAGAFGELYDRHAPRLLGLLARWLGDREEAEDVLQETFWQVWRRAAQYDAGRSPPIVWLVLIARSLALGRLRRRRTGGGPCAADQVAVADDPAGALLADESSRQVREALGRLPEEQRSTILLAFYGGMTHEQIAGHQAVPLGTVKTRIRRGLCRLRQFLNGRVGGP
jgi:RNA polymerase sigma-70 factor (ECF subfamily)